MFHTNSVSRLIKYEWVIQHPSTNPEVHNTMLTVHTMTPRVPASCQDFPPASS